MLQTQLTTQPISCPKCGRDAKPAGFNLVRCEMCGYVERTKEVVSHDKSL